MFVVGSQLSSEGRIPFFGSIKSAFSLPTSALEAEIGLCKRILRAMIGQNSNGH